jgi:hypothetical protein
MLAPGSPTMLAVDATYVYYTDANAGTLSKVPIAGGAATVILSGLAFPTAICVDATSIYWINMGTAPTFTDGAVMKVVK